MARKRLYRSDNAILGGVCAGIAEYLETNSVRVRILAVILLVVFAGAPCIVYLVMWWVIPKKPACYTGYVDVVPESSRSTGSSKAPSVTSECAYTPSNGTSLDTSDAASASAGSSVSTARISSMLTTEGTVRAHATTTTSRSNRIVVAGAILIILGITAFASYLIEGVSLWEYWPLALVVAGVYIIYWAIRNRRAFAISSNGILLVAVGIMLLACCLGMIPLATFTFVFALWPLLLIALGMLFFSIALHSPALNVVAVIVAGLAIGLGVYNCQTGSELLLGSSSLQTRVLFTAEEQEATPVSSASLTGVDSADLIVRMSTPNFSLLATDSDDASLYTSTGVSTPSSMSFDSAAQLLSVHAQGSGLPDSSELDIPEDVSWESITLYGSSNWIDVDLSGISTSWIDIQANMAVIALTLDEAQSLGSFAAVDSNFSMVAIAIPEDVEACIWTSGIDDIDISGDIGIYTNGTELVYATSDAALSSGEASSVWSITVEGNMTTLQIVRLDS